MKSNASVFSSSLVAICCFFSSFAFASAVPEDLMGTYTYQGQTESLMAREYLVVYGFTEKGRTQLQDLMTQGYVCTNTGREIFRCEKNLSSAQVPPAVADRINKKYAGLSIQFLNRVADPYLVNDAVSLKEWEISQTVTFENRTFKKYRYMILNDEIHKIALGDFSASDAVYFTLSPQKSLQYLYEETEQRAQGYVVYRGFVNLQK